MTIGTLFFFWLLGIAMTTVFDTFYYRARHARLELALRTQERSKDNALMQAQLWREKCGTLFTRLEVAGLLTDEELMARHGGGTHGEN